MIIEGRPDLGLQQHQQDAYSAVNKAYETGNRASVVVPTGCGKSFIALQLMQDNRDKRMLFLAPTEAIKNQMYQYIAKYIVGEEPSYGRSAIRIAEEHFPNLKIALYPTLLRMKTEQMEKLNPDIIIMDELHRTGADKWGEKVDTLLDMNPNAKVLGLTATPDRMDDKNVVDELFGGKVDYELTLVDAIKNGIVKPPSYVKCDYALGEQLDYIKEVIERCQDDKTKKELEQKYEKMRKIVERADGIPELFNKNLPKKDGKYIVFCKDKEHMDEIMQICGEWFSGIDTEPEMYSVYSKLGKDYNKKQIKGFEDSKSGHLKLLFSVDMLNEGLHVEDISGAIMLRPTESRIIYLQQLGRTLSSDTSREKTIVFDLVNNYLKNNLDAEINQGRKSLEDIEHDIEPQEGERDDTGRHYGDIDIFRIQGETREFLELLAETKGVLEISDYLVNARAIKLWMEERNTTRPPSAKAEDVEEKRLGTALTNIVTMRIKPYKGLKTDEERDSYREKYPYIEELVEIVEEIGRSISPYLANARAIKSWMEERNTTNVPRAYSEEPEEKRLGNAFYNIKSNRVNPYKELKNEEERKRYREEYPEIEELVEIVEEIDRNNISLSDYLVNARAVKKWMDERNTTQLPSEASGDSEQKKLISAWHGLRKERVLPYKRLKTKEEREKYREKYPYIEELVEIVEGIDRNNLSEYLVNARAIKKWMEERKTTIPPKAGSKNPEERRLGKLLYNLRYVRINPYKELQTEEEKQRYREKYPEIEELVEIVEEIDRNNISLSDYLVNARAIKKWMEERKTIKPPARNSKDAEEKRLGTAQLSIRNNMIKPYMELKTEEEREKYREEYPEIEELLIIMSEIDINSKHAKTRELASLIREDIEKRNLLEQARALEKEYKAQLDKQKDNEKQCVGGSIGE